MLRKFALGLFITAFACAGASAATFKYQEEGYNGSLEINQTSPESYSLKINTTQVTNFHTCEIDSRSCSLVDNNILICDLVEFESTPVVAKLYVNGVKVISGDRGGLCGLNGNFFGLYKQVTVQAANKQYCVHVLQLIKKSVILILKACRFLSKIAGFFVKR